MPLTLFYTPLQDHMTSSCSSTPLDESTNQNLSLLDMPVHMCPKAKTDTVRFTLLPALLESTTDMHKIPQLTSCLQFYSYLLLLLSSAHGKSNDNLVPHAHISHVALALVHVTNGFFSFADGRLDIQADACSHPESFIHPYFSA